jgi:hypothetical protein
MDEMGEKVTLPFDEGGEDGPGAAPPTDGTLALSPADPARANAEETVARLADYARTWGISVATDLSPATKAQVAYWHELCGAISLTGTENMRDSDWPAGLAPAKPTLQAMADRGLIARRRRA